VTADEVQMKLYQAQVQAYQVLAQAYQAQAMAPWKVWYGNHVIYKNQIGGDWQQELNEHLLDGWDIVLNNAILIRLERRV